MSTGKSSPQTTYRGSLIMLFFLVVLCIVGVAITDYSPADAHLYWVFMVLVCALVSIVRELVDARRQGEHLSGVMVQLVHWSACLVAVLITYVLVSTGRVNNADAGLILMLLLALTVFLDGAHLGMHAYLLGVLLAVMTVTMAYIEQFLWIILLASAAVMLVAFYLDRLRVGRSA